MKVALTAPRDQPGAEGVNKKPTEFPAAHNEELAAPADDGTFLKPCRKCFPDLPRPTRTYRFRPTTKDRIVKQQAGKPVP